MLCQCESVSVFLCVFTRVRMLSVCAHLALTLFYSLARSSLFHTHTQIFSRPPFLAQLSSLARALFSSLPPFSFSFFLTLTLACCLSLRSSRPSVCPPCLPLALFLCVLPPPSLACARTHWRACAAGKVVNNTANICDVIYHDWFI